MALTRVQSEMAGAGQVIQAVSASYTGQTSVSGTTWTSTGLTASITPKSASSKILVLVSGNALYTGSSGNEAFLTIYRNSTNLANNPAGTIYQQAMFCLYSPSTILTGNSIKYLDSPATTSSTTYTLYVAAYTGQTVYFNGNSTTSYITLLEVAG